MKVVLILCLTVCAVALGYKYLSIRPQELLQNRPPEPDPAPALTLRQLPEEAEYPESAQPVPPSEPAVPDVAIQSNEDRIVAHVADYIQVNGSDVMDSRYFADSTACDAAVRKVAAEYKNRGVREQDMAETASFPDSKGVVVMFNSQGTLYYIGCFSPLQEKWGVYVQFRPRGDE